MGIEVRRVEALEGLADLAAELYPATSRQAVVCGIPNQGMGEAHAPDHARDLGNDARLDPLVEQLEDAVTLESADTRQRIEIELAPEHRGQGEQSVAFVGQMSQPAADHLSHALRDRKRRCWRLVEALFGGQQPHDLPDE